MKPELFIEVHCQQKNYEGQRICGDVFISRKIREENRLILVLSDGMGHGVKANVLATLTATMSLNFTREHKDTRKIAEIIMKTLPVCSERKMSYSTFTIVDIENGEQINVIEYDNPATVILRNMKILHPEREILKFQLPDGNEIEISTFSFIPELEDRIIFCTDGITQSGLGSESFPFGWGNERLENYIRETVNGSEDISARQLAGKIIGMAYQNDHYNASDDSSCAVVYFRCPRKLLICSGPPFEEKNDHELAEMIRTFEGKKIICGATTGDIIAREMGLKITDSFEFTDPDLPPVSFMQGIDLMTEGILTLGKVNQLLEYYSESSESGKGPADEIIKLLLESDNISFIIGTKINEAHQDPSLPVELEIRRTVVKRMAGILEEKFMKEVNIKYL